MLDLESLLGDPTYVLVNESRKAVVGHYHILKYARVRRTQLGRKGYSIYRVITAEKVEVD